MHRKTRVRWIYPTAIVYHVNDTVMGCLRGRIPPSRDVQKNWKGYTVSCGLYACYVIYCTKVHWSAAARRVSCGFGMPRIQEQRLMLFAGELLFHSPQMLFEVGLVRVWQALFRCGSCFLIIILLICTVARLFVFFVVFPEQKLIVCFVGGNCWVTGHVEFVWNDMLLRCNELKKWKASVMYEKRFPGNYSML